MKRTAKRSPHRGRRRFSSKFDADAASAALMGALASQTPTLSREAIENWSLLPEREEPHDEATIFRWACRNARRRKDGLAPLPLPKAKDDMGLWTFEQLAHVPLQIKRSPDPDHPLMKYLMAHDPGKPLPLDKLREVMSVCPRVALVHFRCVQETLGHLYELASWGGRSVSVAAKKQIEALLPSGNEHPVTKVLPEIVHLFRRKRACIVASDAQVRQERPKPKEVERVKRLSALYNEDSATIHDALHQPERAFLVKLIVKHLPVSETQAKRVVSAAMRDTAK